MNHTPDDETPTSGRQGRPSTSESDPGTMVPVPIEQAASGGALVFGPETLAALPKVIADAGEDTARRFLEFFAANIRNTNTRAAYAKAVGRFLAWADERELSLQDIDPLIVSVYVEGLTRSYAAPTVKQHLAAIRMMFDWLVTGGMLRVNPATAVRGPKHVVKTGKTPVLDPDQARELLDSIDPSTVVGLRDRAIISVMLFSFARVSAAAAMKVEDYAQDGKRWTLRLHEKGGKQHKVPAHHKAEEALDAYLDTSGLRGSPKTPLFRTVRRAKLTDNAMTRGDVLAMIKRRGKRIGLPPAVCCHTFRATGITAYLENGGTLENAQAIAAHESPRTTKLYDRTNDELTLEEIERIRI